MASDSLTLGEQTELERKNMNKVKNNFLMFWDFHQFILSSNIVGISSPFSQGFLQGKFRWWDPLSHVRLGVPLLRGVEFPAKMLGSPGYFHRIHGTDFFYVIPSHLPWKIIQSYLHLP